MILALEKAADVHSDSIKKLEKMVSKGNTLLLNHATWCGHCNVFMPEWQKVSSDVKRGVNFVQIENEALQKLKQENSKLYKRVTPKDGMIYFPMVVVFIRKNSDKPSQKKIYEGNRTSQSLRNYINENMRETKSSKTPKSKTEKKKTVKQPEKTASQGGFAYKSLHDLNRELDDLINRMSQVV